MFDSICSSQITLESLKETFREFNRVSKPLDIEIKYEPEVLERLGYKVYVDDYLMNTETWTGRWLIEGNDFYQYWDGKGQPPSWAIYCGFVKKEMRRNPMYLFDSKRMLMMSTGF